MPRTNRLNSQPWRREHPRSRAGSGNELSATEGGAVGSEGSRAGAGTPGPELEKAPEMPKVSCLSLDTTREWDFWGLRDFEIKAGMLWEEPIREEI